MNKFTRRLDAVERTLKPGDGEHITMICYSVPGEPFPLIRRGYGAIEPYEDVDALEAEMERQRKNPDLYYKVYIGWCPGRRDVVRPV